MANINKINVNGTDYDIQDTVSGYITSASLPAVNDATLTIQKNGTNVQTFTANQSTNATANIVVPEDAQDISCQLTVGSTQTSDVQDALDALNSAKANTNSLATVATSGSYNDLSNKPAIPTITYGTSDPSGGSDGDIYIKYEA